jgi:hypothetical protein
MQPCDIRHTTLPGGDATYAVGARARTAACSGAADKHEGVEYLAYASHGATAGITVPWAHSELRCGFVRCACLHAVEERYSLWSLPAAPRTQSLCGRAGRTLETPGEDPFLNGEYGASHTQGLQA